jgi:signal transduction histidine kinase
MSRRNAILADMRARLHARTDRILATLLIGHWLLATALCGFSAHIVAVAGLGGILSAIPAVLCWRSPGWWVTRHAVAIATMLWSALLLLVAGTHLHVFGSLAVVALYRDWKLLPGATALAVVDLALAHSGTGALLQELGFLALFAPLLVFSCVRSVDEMREAAKREAKLERTAVIVERKVQERTMELRESREEYRKLVERSAAAHEAQKLESVGRLAAGLAHELNTPIQYANDGVVFVQDALGDLMHLVDDEFLREEMPKALERATDGLERVSRIVKSMNVFAHPNTETTAVDLNRLVELTLTIARNEYRYVADVETRLGDIPRVTGRAGELNQAILNILVNAAHAVGDVVKDTESRGTITIATRTDGDDVVLSIADTGNGIPEDIRSKIFEPFFTTKTIGSGSGQGLAIARSVIVDHHRGSLTFESQLGAGTTFTMRLPA